MLTRRRIIEIIPSVALQYEAQGKMNLKKKGETYPVLPGQPTPTVKALSLKSLVTIGGALLLK